MDGTPGVYGKATFAAGCFWDTEAAFRLVDGVLETVVGYTGGTQPEPAWDQVETGTTGHAQAAGIVYDPAVVSYDQLLEIFWKIHDPSQAGGQGDYSGSQYRSAIFYHTDEQRAEALASRDRLQASETFRNRHILTEILPATQLWPAEEYHQRFYEKCGQGLAVCRQAGDD